MITFICLIFDAEIRSTAKLTFVLWKWFIRFNIEAFRNIQF